MPAPALCWKKICVRPAPRKSPCSAPSPASLRKGRNRFRRARHRADRTHAAAARRHGSLSPRSRPQGQRHAGGSAAISCPDCAIPAFTHVLIVTLPEATPVHEAAALQADLRRAQIEPFAWVINQSFVEAQTARSVARAPAGRRSALHSGGSRATFLTHRPRALGARRTHRSGEAATTFSRTRTHSYNGLI